VAPQVTEKIWLRCEMCAITQLISKVPNALAYQAEAFIMPKKGL
jgi:hypothetical protein